MASLAAAFRLQRSNAAATDTDSDTPTANASVRPRGSVLTRLGTRKASGSGSPSPSPQATLLIPSSETATTSTAVSSAAASATATARSTVRAPVSSATVTASAGLASARSVAARLTPAETAPSRRTGNGATLAAGGFLRAVQGVRAAAAAQPVVVRPKSPQPVAAPPVAAKKKTVTKTADGGQKQKRSRQQQRRPAVPLATLLPVTGSIPDRVVLNPAANLTLERRQHVVVLAVAPVPVLQRLTAWDLQQRLPGLLGPRVAPPRDLRVGQLGGSGGLGELRFEGLADSESHQEALAARLEGLRLKMPAPMQDVLLSLEASATDSAKVQLDDAVAAAETAFKYDFDECDPGERPDTIRLTGLPRRWFRASSQTPSASHGLDLQAVVTALAAFGPVVSIELVVAEVSCSLEGPDVTETVDGTDVTVHVRPLLGSTPQGGAAAAGLNFEAFAVYRTAAAALQAVASFTGRQLTFTIPERGPFYADVGASFDLQGYMTTRARRGRRMQAEQVQLQRAEAEAARLAAQEAEQQRKAAEEADRKRIEAERKAEEEALRVEKERRREERRIRKEAERALEEEARRLVEEARRADEERRLEAEAQRREEQARKRAEEEQRRTERRQAERRRAAEEEERRHAAQLQREEAERARLQALMVEKEKLLAMKEQLAQRERQLAEEDMVRHKRLRAVDRPKEGAVQVDEGAGPVRAAVDDVVEPEQSETDARAAEVASDRMIAAAPPSDEPSTRLRDRLRMRMLEKKDELAAKRRKLALARLHGAVEEAHAAANGD